MSAVSPLQAHWTSRGLIEGARATLPLMPGVFAFSMVFGMVAAQAAFSLGAALTMSGAVYAGMSQVLAVQNWPSAFTWGSLASLALVTATVNMRFVLMGATLRPWLGTLPAWQTYPLLFLITDGGWLLAMRYHDEGGADASFYLGGALLSFAVWFCATIPGFLLSASLADPKVYGLDMVMGAFFAAMLVPAWRGSRRAVPWVVAGIVAITVEWLVAGWWFIIAGAIAGSIAGGLIDDA
jgi:predicted branched-subunit amino acid permease